VDFLPTGHFSYHKGVPVTFLPVMTADLDRVVEMMAQLYGQGNARFDPGRARRATEGLLAEPEFGGAWTMAVDGRLAGYIVVLLGYSLEFGGRYGLLDELFVVEDCRGKGIGSEALAFAGELCRARGWQALRLEVGRENHRAMALYSRSGFEIHDRFLMTKWM
jgi:GNAT superfamily N-acetyltransferase